MQNEMISVIVPVYNIEPYIEKCIKSILFQTYDNLEIIVVNDGSTDNSFDLCCKLAMNDPRIRVINQKNAGLSEARNAGLRIARGKYIAFVDGDDYIDEQMYEKLFERLIEDQSDLALCNVRYVDEKGQGWDKCGFRFDLRDEILCEDEFWKGYYGSLHIPYVVSWNKLYKREVFNDIAFNKGKIHEDEFILHKIISQCGKISVIREPFYNYVQRSGGIMNSPYRVQRLQVVEAYNLRLQYFVQKEINFINPTMLRILTSLLDAKENLDFSAKANSKQYNEMVKIYKKNFRQYFKRLNMAVIMKSLLFLSCSPIYLYLRKLKREIIKCLRISNWQYRKDMKS